MQESQLSNIVALFKSIGFSKSKLLVKVILIITIIGDIGLYKIASKLDTKAKRHDSKEKSIRRLLDTKIGSNVYASLIDKLFAFSSNSYEFAMDRTNWKLGKKSVNLFILSFNWHNIAIPIYWVFLDNKGGNSTGIDRIKLITWFISNFGVQNIANLYADREFPSIEFLRFLLNKNINFVFRIKDNIITTDTVKKNFQLKTLNALFRELASGQYKAENKIRRILDNRLFVAAKRNSRGELIVLVSNQYYKDPFALYAHRWNIECMFNKLKSSGFNLENTNVTKDNRVVTLFAIIAIAYCYCAYLGNMRNNIRPIKQKIIHKVETRSVSVFRYGFNLIQHIIAMCLWGQNAIFSQLLQILTGTSKKPKQKLVNLMLNF